MITGRAINIGNAETLNIELSDPQGPDGTFLSAFTPNGSVTAMRTLNARGRGMQVMRAGDMDGNGLIKSADYSLWRGVWRTQAGLGPAVATDPAIVDLNGDGVVNSADYSLWRGNWQDFANQSLRTDSYLPELLTEPAMVEQMPALGPAAR